MYNAEYKIKDSVDIQQIKNYGYYYTGNVNRGEEYTKDIDDNQLRQIRIKGDWDNRKITYGFPYMDIEYPDIRKYIKDIIDAGLVEKV